MKQLVEVINAQPAQDGAGVSINRLGGGQLHQTLNPFLMIDEINSDNAGDYIAGFPEHPHRGFETITYMKTGGMRHRDHMGNEGVIGSGDIQWMKAGKGVLHSEMPEQDQGLLHGFQIWLNLPASEKMQPAQYQEILNRQMTVHSLKSGGSAKVLAGTVGIDQQNLVGPLQNESTQPVMVDVDLQPNESVSISSYHHASVLVFVYGGETSELSSKQLGVYKSADWDDSDDSLAITAGGSGAQLLVLSGSRIEEPIAQYGPFVMNTREELHQAIADFNDPEFLKELSA